MLKSKINSSNKTKCSSRVANSRKCRACKREMIKHGTTQNGNQRFRCKSCCVTRVEMLVRNGFGNNYDQQIIQLKKEGLGIRSVARVLRISPATVIRRILSVADKIEIPEIPQNEKFQVDELHTFVGNKKREVCVIYSWNKDLKKAISLQVGTRSKLNLRSVVEPLLEAGATNINTDRYSAYVGVIPKKVHTTFKRRNNHIERQNLNLRIHLKRLNRRTICYSKSLPVLTAVVKIYFWG